jgi:RNA polymerase sigma-70 factor (ECF subfamily)
VTADDLELIRTVLAGDRHRFHEIVQRFSGPLLGTLRRVLGDPEERRDVLQETWTRAFERLEDLRSPERLRSWLVSIALNLARERARRPRPVSLEDLPGESLAAPRGGPACDEADVVALVRREIALLPARQAEVFDLRMNHELSHAEIAALLGISEESSRANYYQALRRLRARFPAQAADLEAF